MTRLTSISVDQAEGKTAELYQGVKKALGGVPNLFQTLGNNANALESYLTINANVKTGLLTRPEQEAISLIVAQQNGCNYCLSAHSMLGKMAGLSSDEMIAIRQGASNDAKIQALLDLTSAIVQQKGRVSDEVLNNFRAAGYTDAHVLEVMLAVVVNIFTNYTNELNHTAIDFPAAPELQKAAA